MNEAAAKPMASPSSVVKSTLATKTERPDFTILAWPSYDSGAGRWNVEVDVELERDRDARVDGGRSQRAGHDVGPNRQNGQAQVACSGDEHLGHDRGRAAQRVLRTSHRPPQVLEDVSPLARAGLVVHRCGHRALIRVPAPVGAGAYIRPSRKPAAAAAGGNDSVIPELT